MGMENHKHVITYCGMKLPLGVRFHPTDEELLVYYLIRKCFCFPLPAFVIPEFDVFLTVPWNLPGDSREKRYFFSNKEHGVNSNKKPFRRVAASFGCWKQSGKDRKITIRSTNPIVGIRKALIFYGGNHSSYVKTQWIMHEFHLEGLPSSSNSIQMSNVQCENWKVYKVFQRKMKHKKHENIVPQASAVVIDFKSEDAAAFGSAPPPSPCSSLVDEEE